MGLTYPMEVDGVGVASLRLASNEVRPRQQRYTETLQHRRAVLIELLYVCVLAVKCIRVRSQTKYELRLRPDFVNVGNHLLQAARAPLEKIGRNRGIGLLVPVQERILLLAPFFDAQEIPEVFEIPKVRGWKTCGDVLRSAGAAVQEEARNMNALTKHDHIEVVKTQ